MYQYYFFALASQAISHWGMCPIDFQLFYFIFYFFSGSGIW